MKKALVILSAVLAAACFADNMDNGGQKGLVKSLSAHTLGSTFLNVGGSLRYDRDMGYAKGPLGSGPVLNSAGEELGQDPAQLWSGSVFAACGLNSVLDLSMVFPLYYDVTGFGPDRSGFGDLEVAAKLGYPAQRKNSVVNHAYYLRLILPTGTEDRGFFPRHVYHILDEGDTRANAPFTASSMQFNPMLLWTLDFNALKSRVPLQIHGNFGGVVAPEKSNSTLLGSIAIEYTPAKEVTLFAELNGEARVKFYADSFSVRTFENDPIWLTPGMRFNFQKGIYAILAGHFGLSSQDRQYRTDWVRSGYAYSTAPAPRYGVQLTLGCGNVIREPDSDMDGLIDKKDKCPEAAEDKDGFKDEDGCPDEDNDKDGLEDYLDECPNEKAVCDGCPVYDTDKDGILDDRDQCPKQAEDMDGFEDRDGCPDTDNDKDNVPDSADRCRNEAEDMDGFEDTDGCAEIDNDGDSIPDNTDKCPNHVGLPENQGCPKTAEIRGKLILSGVNFTSGKAVLTRNSFTVLDHVIESLREWPEIRLEIQGHTDDRGDDNFNLQLSQRRADAVREYFISKGIDASRLTAVGYGEQRPVADNTTKKGRVENRRVEIHRVE